MLSQRKSLTVRVLVVEDYEPVRSSVVQALAEEGFAVDSAENGRDGLWLAQSGDYNVIVLDIMLPDTSGIEILQTLRNAQQQVPVLLLTALGAVDERIRGLNIGADDYLIKPFALAELLARVKALVRRSYGDGTTIIQVRDLQIDTNARTVSRNDAVIELTAREYNLLEYFARRRGQVVTRSDVWQSLYDMQSESSSNVVDVYVGYLRKKLDTPGQPSLIQTRRGLGYVLEAE
ncbi:Transcriptional regulatory protein CusR [Rubinisphaera italica]|uniref:Transcriptional regulatory protein CusR n=1 Tax=Rubinisphaera italica TaxID=2527969 RepID=A0A5C5XEG1_9PLAN|nr:Transcriptional regulatory protein CusR [Rubinisphaera italica]